MNRRAAIEGAVRILAPRIPRHEFEAVTDHALGSRGLQAAAPETAAWLSLVAFVRHAFTDYDASSTRATTRKAPVSSSSTR